MKLLNDGRIRCRVKITGTHKGKPFEYVDPEGTDGSQFYSPCGEPSQSWWSEGNMACDCNRCEFIGEKLDCGETICIDTIEPVDYDGEPLILNETRSRA